MFLSSVTVFILCLTRCLLVPLLSGHSNSVSLISVFVSLLLVSSLVVLLLSGCVSLISLSVSMTFLVRTSSLPSKCSLTGNVKMSCKISSVSLHDPITLTVFCSLSKIVVALFFFCVAITSSFNLQKLIPFGTLCFLTTKRFCSAEIPFLTVSTFSVVSNSTLIATLVSQ